VGRYATVSGGSGSDVSDRALGADPGKLRALAHGDLAKTTPVLKMTRTTRVVPTQV